MVLAAMGPPRYRPKSRCDDDMARARTCYDHLAGRLGVALAERLAEREQIVLNEDGGFVTDAGAAFLAGLGVDIGRRKRSRRAFCRPCLDWSERRFHIAGAVGVAIASRCFELGWLLRREHSRAITITPAGEQSFKEVFGIKL